MIRYLPLLTLLAITACNPKSGKQPATTSAAAKSLNNEPVPANRLIVPGKSVGQTAINDNGAEVVQRLDRPDAGDAAMGKALSIWYANHDSTSYQTMVYTSRQMGTTDETSRVQQIRITSPWFKTADGIQVGSALQKIQVRYPIKKAATYNKAQQQYTIYTNPTGIAFEINPQQQCVAIIVYAPDKQPAQLYLPFYDNLKLVK